MDDPHQRLPFDPATNSWPCKCGGWYTTARGELYKHSLSNSGPNPGSNTPIAPGLANRAPEPGPPANWFSIDRETELALAETCAEGDGRYGVDNWRKGIPVSNLLNHAMDHLSRAREGDASEPHIQHAIWNLGKVLWMAKNRPEMVDVPMIRKALGMEPLPLAVKG